MVWQGRLLGVIPPPNLCRFTSCTFNRCAFLTFEVTSHPPLVFYRLHVSGAQFKVIQGPDSLLCKAALLSFRCLRILLADCGSFAGLVESGVTLVFLARVLGIISMKMGSYSELRMMASAFFLVALTVFPKLFMLRSICLFGQLGLLWISAPSDGRARFLQLFV